MIGGSNIKTGVRNDIFADTATDLENLEQFAIDWSLAQGSICLCIETGKFYVLQSTGSWVLQGEEDEPSASTLNLSRPALQLNNQAQTQAVDPVEETVEETVEDENIPTDDDMR